MPRGVTSVASMPSMGRDIHEKGDAHKLMEEINYEILATITNYISNYNYVI